MRTKSFAAAGFAVALLVAAGCGDDDSETDAGADDSSSTAEDAAAGDQTAYCDAALAMDTAPEPELDFEAMSPEEQAEVVKAYAAETLVPLADDIATVAPAELEEDVATARQALDGLVESGDWVAFDEEPAVADALGRLHVHDVETCGWQSVPFTTKDYSFEGLPDELDAGVTSFDLTNEGTEMHEIAVLRKNDGVTESFEEILELPEEEAMAKASFLGVAFGAPGDSEYLVADLEPGEYLAVCFIPVGTTSPDAPPPDAPPHFTHGMRHEFTVS